MISRFILVADTSDAFADILREELTETDYALLHAKDGQEAIDYLELLTSEIEVAIIRLDLPVVSGLDVIGRLVSRKQPKPTRIIATSAVDIPLYRDLLKDLGVEAVVQTPLPLQRWQQTIKAVLNITVFHGTLDSPWASEAKPSDTCGQIDLNTLHDSEITRNRTKCLRASG
jgi:CheY-like chemotaxis protein